MKNGNMSPRLVGMVLLLLVALGPASAQQPAKRTIVLAGKLLDVKSGKLQSNQIVVIEGDKILSVGPASEIKPSPSDTLIDLSNATVLPGWIDAHTHLTFNPQFGYDTLAISVPREALIGAHNARLTLEAGFTTVRNVGASGYSDVALRDA